MLDWELAQFDSAVDDVFGFRAVQIGLPEVDFLRQNRIPYRFSLALEPGASLAADPLQIPLASQSVDLVVLPHVLEGHPNPHDVLREVERVLMPEGQVVISGFNTASLWRVRQLFAPRHNGAPWTQLKGQWSIAAPAAVASVASYLLILWVWGHAPIAPSVNLEGSRRGGRGHWLRTPKGNGERARSARSGNESGGGSGTTREWPGHFADECQAVNSVRGLQ